MNRGPTLLDTGPLVSFLATDLRHHAWVLGQWKLIPPPMLTCEPIIAEAAFLLRREGKEANPLFELLERGVCLVRLSELHANAKVFTLDSDFRLYRRHGNKVIPVLLPD